MDTGIRLARREDIPTLIKLWNACFYDSEEYIDFFYAENFDDISVFVYTVNDLPVSMLHWMDAVFVNGAEQQEAKFLYAGGTDPAYRRRGYYGALFEHVKSLARKNGYALFGKPASRELLPAYQKIGLVQDACFRLVTVYPGEKTPLSVSPVTPELYNRMRNDAFSAHPYAKWPDRHVRFSIAENEWFGGKTVSVDMEGSVHFLMVTPEGDTLLITETDLSLPQLQRASGALCETFGAAKIKAFLPDFSCKDGEEIVSSIVYNTPLCNTYVNLIFV